ncbi:MAG: Gfo/Idh/MocA family protein, partial [Chitinophagales bacterium]
MQRRNFISRLSLCTVGLTVQRSGLIAPLHRANNKIVLALIGCGGRGIQVLNGIIKENEQVEVKYFCDVNETLKAIPEQMEIHKQKQGYAPKFETDMRKVFDDNSVDAVVIATPEHWHTLAAVWALQAGKHVYVEKNPT